MPRASLVGWLLPLSRLRDRHSGAPPVGPQLRPAGGGPVRLRVVHAGDIVLEDDGEIPGDAVRSPHGWNRSHRSDALMDRAGTCYDSTVLTEKSMWGGRVDGPPSGAALIWTHHAGFDVHASRRRTANIVVLAVLFGIVSAFSIFLVCVPIPNMERRLNEPEVLFFPWEIAIPGPLVLGSLLLVASAVLSRGLWTELRETRILRCTPTELVVTRRSGETRIPLADVRGASAPSTYALRLDLVDRAVRIRIAADAGQLLWVATAIRSAAEAARRVADAPPPPEALLRMRAGAEEDQGGGTS